MIILAVLTILVCYNVLYGYLVAFAILYNTNTSKKYSIVYFFAAFRLSGLIGLAKKLNT
jgi:hypothetical protein